MIPDSDLLFGQSFLQTKSHADTPILIIFGTIKPPILDVE